MGLKKKIKKKLKQADPSKAFKKIGHEAEKGVKKVIHELDNAAHKVEKEVIRPIAHQIPGHDLAKNIKKAAGAAAIAGAAMAETAKTTQDTLEKFQETATIIDDAVVSGKEDFKKVSQSVTEGVTNMQQAVEQASKYGKYALGFFGTAYAAVEHYDKIARVCEVGYHSGKAIYNWSRKKINGYWFSEAQPAPESTDLVELENLEQTEASISSIEESIKSVIEREKEFYHDHYRSLNDMYEVFVEDEQRLNDQGPYKQIIARNLCQANQFLNELSISFQALEGQEQIEDESYIKSLIENQLKVIKKFKSINDLLKRCGRQSYQEDTIKEMQDELQNIRDQLQENNTFSDSNSVLSLRL